MPKKIATPLEGSNTDAINNWSTSQQTSLKLIQNAFVGGHLQPLLEDPEFLGVALNLLSQAITSKPTIRKQVLRVMNLHWSQVEDSIEGNYEHAVKAIFASHAYRFAPIESPRYIDSQAKAAAKILASSQFLTAQEVAQQTKTGLANPFSVTTRWTQSNKIFAIMWDGKYRYPAYQFDPQNGFKPYKEVQAILGQFPSHYTKWELAQWFITPNPFLEPAIAPKDLLADSTVVNKEQQLIKAIKMKTIVK
jgi:hypothetical protein